MGLYDVPEVNPALHPGAYGTGVAYISAQKAFEESLQEQLRMGRTGLAQGLASRGLLSAPGIYGQGYGELERGAMGERTKFEAYQAAEWQKRMDIYNQLVDARNMAKSEVERDFWDMIIGASFKLVGTVAGAAIGSWLAPGVGTVVGAGVGAAAGEAGAELITGE